MSAAAVTSIGRCASAVRVVIVLLAGWVACAGVAEAQTPPETVEYYATDALGSVRIVFNAQGQVLGRSDYLPFGETLTQSGSLPRQRFTGQERDGEAGLDYFNARDLQTRTGRMNAPDPLSAGAMGDPQGWNRYAYVANNPLRFTDPTGMLTFKVLIVGHLADQSKPEYPPEQMSEAAMEGSSDLIAGAGGNSWYEWLSGGTDFFPFFGQHASPGAQSGQKPSPPPPGNPGPGDPPPPRPASPTVASIRAEGSVQTGPKGNTHKPDYGTVSLGLGGPIWGVIVSCSKDSFGHYYCGGGASAGKTYMGFGLDYQTGNMLTPQPPSEEQLQRFLTGWAVNGGVCLVLCGSVSVNSSGGALQQGLGFPQLGVSGTWMWHVW